MIYPSECDDALDAVRTAREACGDAVDELHRLRATTGTVAPFVRAHDAVAYAAELIADLLVTTSRTAVELEDVETRHVDAQVFPWIEEDR